MEDEAPNTVAGLIRKRRQIAAEIEDAQMRLRQSIIDLDHIDATIRLFRPDIDLEVIKPNALPPRHSASKGEMGRIILSALRESGRPMRSRELTNIVMEKRGLNVSDKGIHRMIQRRVGACLKHYKHKGVLVSQKGPGSFLLWSVVHKVTCA